MGGAHLVGIVPAWGSDNRVGRRPPHRRPMSSWSVRSAAGGRHVVLDRVIDLNFAVHRLERRREPDLASRSHAAGPKSWNDSWTITSPSRCAMKWPESVPWRVFVAMRRVVRDHEDPERLAEVILSVEPSSTMTRSLLPSAISVTPSTKNGPHEGHHRSVVRGGSDVDFARDRRARRPRPARRRSTRRPWRARSAGRVVDGSADVQGWGHGHSPPVGAADDQRPPSDPR